MKKALAIAVCVSLALVSGAAFAGEKGNCGASAENCLNHMAAAYKDKGWAGVEMDYKSGDFPTVTAVYEGSPAEKAKVKVGDELVAVNGIRLSEENESKLHGLWSEMKAGRTFEYTLSRGGKERTVDLTLAPMSEEMVAKVVGAHMLADHATIEMASAD